MTSQSTLTITGGPQGVVASLEDLRAIKGTLVKTRDQLLLAASDTNRACAVSYGFNDYPVWACISDAQAVEVKQRLEPSRTTVVEGMEDAVNSENRPDVISVEADGLVNAIAETIETYEAAEREATPSATFFERFELFRNWFWGTVAGSQLGSVLGFPFGPAGSVAGLVVGARIGGPVGEGIGLYSKAIEGMGTGDELAADIIRENHLAIRQMLNELVRIKPWGVPTTTELAGGLARVDKAFNKLAPWEDLNGIKVTSQTVPQITGFRHLSELMALVDDAHAGGKRIDGQPSDMTRHGFYLCKTKSAGGKTTWTVVIPGTSTGSLIIGPNHQDTLSNLLSVGQMDTSLSRAIEETLDKAAVGPSDKVLLAGHSQGGIIAARLAQKLSENNRLNNMSLLTVGSPIAEYSLPTTVKILAVEHREDIVPALSGPKNPDGSNWITVSREVSKGPDAIDVRNDIGAAHGSGLYARTLDLIESEGSRETDAWRSEVSPVFASESTTVATFYNVTRVAVSNPVATGKDRGAMDKNQLKDWLRSPACFATVLRPPGLGNNCLSWPYPTR